MGKISNIQVLRGLAALAVVVFHAREEVDAVGHATAWPDFKAGAFGVDLFFVVSGFVMVYASVPLFGTWRSALPFLAKRLARIVPLYWLITALFAVYVAQDPAEPMGRHALVRFLWTSFAFVPYLAPANPDAYPVYPLGWTLDYEMFFYLCFAACLALPRRAAVAVLCFGFAALVTLAATVALPDPLAYLGATQVLEFAAGMGIAQAFLAGWRVPRRVSLGIVLAAVVVVPLAATEMDAWWGSWRGVVWGLPAAAIVGAAALRPALGEGGPVRRWFEKLGDASYALYLVHYGLYMAIEAVLGRVVALDRVPASPFMAVLIGAALLAAFAVHRRVEVPLTRSLQRLVLPRRAAPSVVPIRT